MCSDRESIYEIQIIMESDTKYVQYIWTVEREDTPANPDCVRMEFFKMRIYEQVGADVICKEAQVVDISGYFPKSVLNKL